MGGLKPFNFTFNCAKMYIVPIQKTDKKCFYDCFLKVGFQNLYRFDKNNIDVLNYHQNFKIVIICYFCHILLLIFCYYPDNILCYLDYANITIRDNYKLIF